VQRRYPGTRAFDARCLRLKDYLRALRVHQWLKNLLIVVPSVAAHRFGFREPDAARLAFLISSFCHRAVYLLNDLLDLRNTVRIRPSATARSLRRCRFIHGIRTGAGAHGAGGGARLALPREFLAILVGYYLITMVIRSAEAQGDNDV